MGPLLLTSFTGYQFATCAELLLVKAGSVGEEGTMGRVE